MTPDQAEQRFDELLSRCQRMLEQHWNREAFAELHPLVRSARVATREDDRRVVVEALGPVVRFMELHPGEPHLSVAVYRRKKPRFHAMPDNSELCQLAEGWDQARSRAMRV